MASSSGADASGRPWLFRDLVEALNGRPVPPSPTLGEACEVMARHGRLLAEHLGENLAMRDFRKHTSWYLTGYPVGGEVRRRFANISTLGRARGPDLCARPDHHAGRGRRADPPWPHQRPDPRRPAGWLPRSPRRPRRAGRFARDGAQRRMTRVVLASGSPRRHELLSQIGVQFAVRVPDIDESPLRRRATRGLRAAAGIGKGCRRVECRRRGRDRRRHHRGSRRDDPRQAARRRATPHRCCAACPARTHRVHTGVAVRRGDHELAEVCTTLVTFVALDEAMIRWYVSTGEPIGKAGVVCPARCRWCVRARCRRQRQQRDRAAAARRDRPRRALRRRPVGRRRLDVLPLSPPEVR